MPWEGKQSSGSLCDPWKSWVEKHMFLILNSNTIQVWGFFYFYVSATIAQVQILTYSKTHDRSHNKWYHPHSLSSFKSLLLGTFHLLSTWKVLDCAGFFLGSFFWGKCGGGVVDGWSFVSVCACEYMHTCLRLDNIVPSLIALHGIYMHMYFLNR